MSAVLHFIQYYIELVEKNITFLAQPVCTL